MLAIDEGDSEEPLKSWKRPRGKKAVRDAPNEADEAEVETRIIEEYDQVCVTVIGWTKLRR